MNNIFYKHLRVLNMIMELDNTQGVILHSRAVFMYFSSFQNCNKQNIAWYFKINKINSLTITDYLSRCHRLGKAGLRLITKERDNKDKPKNSLKHARKGRDRIEKLFGMLNEDIIDFENEE